MTTFKEYFITEMAKNKKKKQTIKDLHTNLSRGPEFSMVGAGKSGVMQSDKKGGKKRRERKEGKEQTDNAMRGEY
mgnify:CR=1 FL=1